LPDFGLRRQDGALGLRGARGPTTS
jgi:hypothetical protein